MAIFEKESVVEGKPFIALLDAEGTLVAFVQPASKVDPVALVEALSAKGLNVELREPKASITTVVL